MIQSDEAVAMRQSVFWIYIDSAKTHSSYVTFFAGWDIKKSFECLNIIEVNIEINVFFKGCGGRITGVSGSLHSPGYPSSYPRLSNCKWTLDVNTTQRIQFTISSLELTNVSDTTCRFVVLVFHKENKIIGYFPKIFRKKVSGEGHIFGTLEYDSSMSNATSFWRHVTSTECRAYSR